MADKDKFPKNNKPNDFKFEDTDSLKAQVMSALEKNQQEHAGKMSQHADDDTSRISKNNGAHTASERSTSNSSKNTYKTSVPDHDRFSRRIQERLEEEKMAARQGSNKKKAKTGSSAKGGATQSSVGKRKISKPVAGAAIKNRKKNLGKGAQKVTAPTQNFDEIPMVDSDVPNNKRPANSAENNSTARARVQNAQKANTEQKNTAVTKKPAETGKFLPKSTRQRLSEALAIPTAEDELENSAQHVNNSAGTQGANHSRSVEGTHVQQAASTSSASSGQQQGQHAQPRNNGQQTPASQSPTNSQSQSQSNSTSQGQQNTQPQPAAASPEHADLLRKIPQQKKKPITEFLEEVEQLPEEQRRQAVRKKENNIVRRIVTILLLVFAVVAIIAGISLWNFWQSGQKPLDTSNSKTELVEIPLGSSNKQIAGILEKDKIIKSAVVFNYYMKLNNKSGFQAGFYKLAPNMTLDQIAKKLVDGDSVKQNLLVPEGYTIDEIAATVEKNTPYTSAEFLAVIKDDKFFATLLKDFPKLLASASTATDERYKLEGYLFPATYTLTPGSDAEGLVYQMVQKTDQIMSQYYDEIAAQQLTVHQVLTLASLVEKEGVKDEDRRNIAQVFFNRLHQDMPLQSDISILYAMNEHKVTLTVKDTQIDSPYNLYVNKGYGPGPFDNPSENAVKAVLYPAANDYYYFVADVDTGQVYFAQTFDEHNALVDQYVNKK